jgi:Outer membrane protein transport protein (OMPP1/FadL/TodX)
LNLLPPIKRLIDLKPGPSPVRNGLNPNLKSFDVAPQTTPSGGSGGNAGVFMPLGSFFYVHRVSDRIRAGVAVFSDFGLGGNYGKEWVGRYYVTEEALVTAKINPVIAYRLTDWLSVGAGGSFAVGRLTFQSRINNALPRLGNGRYALESWDEAFGGNAGVLLIPIPELRLGLTYQSPQDFKFGFNPFLTGLGPGFRSISRFGVVCGATSKLVKKSSAPPAASSCDRSSKVIPAGFVAAVEASVAARPALAVPRSGAPVSYSSKAAPNALLFESARLIKPKTMTMIVRASKREKTAHLREITVISR